MWKYLNWETFYCYWESPGFSSNITQYAKQCQNKTFRTNPTDFFSKCANIDDINVLWTNFVSKCVDVVPKWTDFEKNFVVFQNTL